MEQRNGRIDRHGQKAKEVRVYHFVGKDYQHNATTGLRLVDCSKKENLAVWV
jgi:hypothetical protein